MTVLSRALVEQSWPRTHCIWLAALMLRCVLSQDERLQTLQLALDRAKERSGAVEAAVKAQREREAALRAELRAVRAVRERTLSRGDVPPSRHAGRGTAHREGVDVPAQVHQHS